MAAAHVAASYRCAMNQKTPEVAAAYVAASNRCATNQKTPENGGGPCRDFEPVRDQP
jgi:hypothetical protein